MFKIFFNFNFSGGRPERKRKDFEFSVRLLNCFHFGREVQFKQLESVNKQVAHSYRKGNFPLPLPLDASAIFKSYLEMSNATMTSAIFGVFTADPDLISS